MQTFPFLKSCHICKLKKIERPVLGLAFFISSVTLSAQTIPQRLDSFFNSVCNHRQMNGNILVAENGKVVYEKSFGFADIKNKIVNNDSSVFTLASVSKTLTATAILQLKEKGKLQLDDAVIKYFPDFPYAGISIRHLLSHTSGLPEFEIFREQMSKNPDKVFTNKDLMPSLQIWKKPLHFAPGEKWEYANTNFCLLALLVEKLSKMTFQKYMEKFIFIPAKMNKTYFQADTSKKSDKNNTINYEYPWLFSSEMQPVDSQPKFRERLVSLSGFVGNGNIMTTARDLLNFDAALYNNRLLKYTTLQEAFVPAKLNNGQNTNASIGIGKASYGLGWFIFDDTSKGKIVWHTGGVPGGLSIFIRNISRRQTIICFDNEFNKSLYRNGINAMNILNHQPIAAGKKSLIQDYGMALVNKGSDFAFCRLLQLKSDSAHYYLSEDDMNDLGLQLLYAGNSANHKELSLEVLKLNTLLFPNSFNTYDSYGEALANAGKKKRQ